MSYEANNARRERRRTERRYARTKSDEDCKKCRAFCRKTELLVREACCHHVCSEIADVVQNPWLLWRSVKSLLHPGCTADVWYKGLNTDVLAHDLCLYFSDKLKRIAGTIADGLRATFFCLPICPSAPVTSRFTMFPRSPKLFSKLASSAS